MAGERLGAKLKGRGHDFHRCHERRAIAEPHDHGEDFIRQIPKPAEAELRGCLEKCREGDGPGPGEADGEVAVERRLVESTKGQCRGEAITLVVEDSERWKSKPKEQGEAGKVREGGTGGEPLVASVTAEAEVVTLPDVVLRMKPRTCRDRFLGSSWEGFGVYCGVC